MEAFGTEVIKKTASTLPVRKLISLVCIIDLSLLFPVIGAKCQMPNSVTPRLPHQKQIFPHVLFGVVCFFFKQADLSS